MDQEEEHIPLHGRIDLQGDPLEGNSFHRPNEDLDMP